MSIFQSIRVKSPKKTAFNLSHEVKGSYQMNNLYPIFCKMVNPGDRFQLTSEIMMRFAPLISPVMHRINVYTYSFFVPMRLIWDNWEDFITAGVTGTDKPVLPYINIGSDRQHLLEVGALSDYMGIPPVELTGEAKFNSLAFRAYQLIYNEYFRDQNLEDEIPIYKGDGMEPDEWIDDNGNEHITYIDTLMSLRKKCWEKDYFTSALPWTQRGPDVRLPLTGSGDVVLDTSSHVPGNFLTTEGYRLEGDGNVFSREGNLVVEENGQPVDSVYDPNGTLKVDSDALSSTTINEFRRSLAIQRWLERNARAGSRYIEQILSHFGVRSSDYRLQRPQFLGAGSSPVVISEVLQTSQSTIGDGGSAQGTMAGHGIVVGNTHGFKSHKFEEHGFIIQLMCVIPRTQYFQGLDRMWTVRDNLDFYWPEFAHLGEQPVRYDEIYWDPNRGDDYNSDAFGYQSRYAEYKWYPSTVHGEFRRSLDYWHMARKFANRPNLNKEFVQANATTRIFALDDEDQQQHVEKLYCQIYHNCKALRPMPKYGTPMI